LKFQAIAEKTAKNLSPPRVFRQMTVDKRLPHL